MKWSLKNKIQPMLVSKDRNLNIRTEVEEKKKNRLLWNQPETWLLLRDQMSCDDSSNEN